MGAKNTGNDLMFGQEGSIFTNTYNGIVAPVGMVVVAIQMLSDTTFNTLTPSPSAKNNHHPNGICVGDATGEQGKGAGGTGFETPLQGSGGRTINAGTDANLTIFPKGIIIYGRWDSFSIDEKATGGVIAYLAH